MSRRSRERLTREAKRLLGVPLDWSDEVAPRREGEGDTGDESGDDGFFGGSGLRPYLPESGTTIPGSEA